MNIFVQGPRNAGKSTVIKNTLDLLMANKPISIGGFFTWNGGKTDPHVYMRPARIGMENKIIRLASFDPEKGGLTCNIRSFEQNAVQILTESIGSDLIIMDELGFLESNAPIFIKTVLDMLGQNTPILGALRLNVPWHDEIKRHPSVALHDVDDNNRNNLPNKLAAALATML